MKIAIRRIEAAAAVIVSVLFLAGGICQGQAPEQTPPPPEAPGNGVTSIIRKVVLGQEVSGEELRELDSAVISVEGRPKSAPLAADTELPSSENVTEKRIYLLKMESRSDQVKELVELQRNLLRNQLMVLRVLGVIGKHQGIMGQRLARTENLNRELLGGMQDTGRSVDMARTDIASTLGETTDISEMTEDMMMEVEEMQKQLEDIETGISGLQDTTGEILDTVGDMGS